MEYPPSPETIATFAAEGGHLHILNWLEQNNLLPDQLDLIQVRDKGLLNWFGQRGTFQNGFWTRQSLAS